MSRVEVSKKLVMINSASSAGSLLLNVTVLIWLQQYLIKRISPEEFSLLPIVMALMAFTPLMTRALVGGLGRYITIAYAKGDDEQITRITSTMLPILLLAATCILCIGGIAAWKVESLIKVSTSQVQNIRIMLCMLFADAAFRLPAAVFGVGFAARQKYAWLDLIQVCAQFLKFSLLFALLFGVSTRIIWVVAATAIAGVLQTVVATVVSVRLVPAQRFLWSSMHFPLAKELIGYGGWVFVEHVAWTVRNTMDPLLLNRFGTAIDVATFHVAGIGARQIETLRGPLSRPFFPVLAALHTQGNLARMARIYLRAARYHSWLSIMVAVPAIVFSDLVMDLYLGDIYPDAGKVMALLLLVPVLNSFNALGNAVAEIQGAVRGHALRHLLVHGSNLLLTVCLVGFLKQGAVGSALATVLAMVTIEAVVTWPFCRGLIGVSTGTWLREVVVPSVLPALPALIVALYFRYGVGISSLLELAGVSALCAAVYLVVLVTVGLRPEDRADFKKGAEKLPQPLRTAIFWVVSK